MLICLLSLAITYNEVSRECNFVYLVRTTPQHMGNRFPSQTRRYMLLLISWMLFIVAPVRSFVYHLKRFLATSNFSWLLDLLCAVLP